MEFNFEVLLRMIELMDPINVVLLFYNLAAGKKEFNGIKTTIK